MSQEAVIQFFDAVYQNKELQGQLNYGFATAAPKAVIQIAQDNGYSFAASDLKAALDKQVELTDRQLDAVAGGLRNSFIQESGPSWVQNQPYRSEMQESQEKEAVNSSPAHPSVVETFRSLMG